MPETRRIFLIDDLYEEDGFLGLLQGTRGFDPALYTFSAESNGSKAVSDLQGMSPLPDVVLLDYQFEGQPEQGDELLPQIKEIDRSLPVIMLTSVSGDPDLVQRIKQQGAFYYFPKDRLTDLPQLVEEALANPHEREFQKRIELLRSKHLRQEYLEFLQTALDALILLTLNEFETARAHLRHLQVSGEIAQLRKMLFLKAAILASGQAVEQHVDDERRRRRRDYPEFNSWANISDKINQLAKHGLLEPRVKYYMELLNAMRNMVAHPGKESLTMLADATIALDLALSIFENRRLNTSAQEQNFNDCRRYSEWSLQNSIRKFGSSVGRDAETELQSALNLLETDPAMSSQKSYVAVGHILRRVALLLRKNGYAVSDWNPATEALSNHTSEIEKVIRQAIIDGIKIGGYGLWQTSEKVLRKGTYPKWSEELATKTFSGNPQPADARISLRVALSVAEWYADEFLTYQNTIPTQRELARILSLKKR